MTNDEVLAAINAKALADPLFDALVSDRRDTEITAALNAGLKRFLIDPNGGSPRLTFGL